MYRPTLSLPDSLPIFFDVFSAMEKDSDASLRGLLADGGASANDFLMQLQADILDRPVSRGDQAEVGAMGVAKMAFGSLGVSPPPSEVRQRSEEHTLNSSH